jgi:hypothetical protein
LTHTGFYINLPIGAVTAMLLLLTSIPEHVPKASPRTVPRTAVHSLDLVGFAIFSPAATMFFLALELGGKQYAWSSAVVTGLLCGAFATFVIFFAWERSRCEAAMMPFSLLRLKLVWSSAAMMSCFLGTMFTVAYYLPIWLQAVKEDSPLMSEVHNIPMFLSQVVVVLIGGSVGGFFFPCSAGADRRADPSVVQRVGYCLPPALFGTMLGSIGAGLLSTLRVSSSVGHWVGFQIIYGVGVGSAAQMVNTLYSFR